MPHCINCGKQVRPNAKYCGNCGKPIEDGGEASSQEGKIEAKRKAKEQIKLNPKLLVTFDKQQLKSEGSGKFTISPDGLMIAWVTSDRKIVDPYDHIFVRNLKSEETRELTLPKIDGGSDKNLKTYPYGDISSIYFSNDGRYFVSIHRHCFNFECAIWETSAWELLHRIPFYACVVQSMALSPQKDRLAVGSSQGLYLLDLKTAEAIVLRGHGPSLIPEPLYYQVNFVAFHPDGKTLYSAADDGKVLYWDLSKNTKDIHVNVLGEHEYAVTCGSLSPDGGLLATSNMFDLEGKGGSTIIWDVDKKRIANKFKKGFYNLSFVSDTDLISRSVREDWNDNAIAEVVSLLDAKKGKLLKRKEIKTSIGKVNLSHAGRYLSGKTRSDEVIQIWRLY